MLRSTMMSLSSYTSYLLWMVWKYQVWRIIQEILDGLSSDEESILESDLDFDSDYSFMFSDNDE